VSLIATHQLIATTNGYLQPLTFKTSPFSYTGEAPLPITHMDLPDSALSTMDVDAADIRAWADLGKTQQIPIDVISANPSWFALSQGVPNYGALIGPAAEYYADLGTSGKIIYARADFLRYYVEAYDCASGTWEDTTLVGAHPDSAVDMGDSHLNPAIVRDSSGTWHLFVDNHDQSADGGVHWTASAYNGPWTMQSRVNDAVTTEGTHSYANASIVGDDIALFYRCRFEIDKKRPMTLYKKSTSFASAEITADLSTGGPSGDDDVRTYFLWIEPDPGNDGRATEKWFHVIFMRHQDDDTWGERRNFLFYAVIRFTLSSGNISSWRWFDINGTALAAADTAIGWTELTASNSTYLIGTSSYPGYVVENTRPTDNVYSVDSSCNIVFDSSDRPHFLINLSTGVDRATSDTLHFTHDGSSWSASAISSLSGFQQVRCCGIHADGDVLSGVLVALTTYGDFSTSAFQYVRFDGSWQVSDIQSKTSPSPSASYQGAEWGTLIAVVVKNKPPSVAGPDVISCPFNTAQTVDPNDGSITYQHPAAGGMPIFAFDRDGEVVRTKRALIVVRPSVVAGSDTTIYLSWGDGGATPGESDANGAQAVWADYDCVSFVEPLHLDIDPNFTNRAGGTLKTISGGEVRPAGRNVTIRYSTDSSKLAQPPMWVTHKNGLPCISMDCNGA